MPSLTIELLEKLVPDWSEWPIFIETGTYYADTVLAMQPHFREVHSIELSQRLWDAATRRCSSSNIRLHLGDSPEVLKILLPQLDAPAIFFLDSHWSCGDTAKGKLDVPLLEELRVIHDFFKLDAAIIIDDKRLFGKGPMDGEPVDWSNVNIAIIQKIAGDRYKDLEVLDNLDKVTLQLHSIAPH